MTLDEIALLAAIWLLLGAPLSAVSYQTQEVSFSGRDMEWGLAWNATLDYVMSVPQECLFLPQVSNIPVRGVVEALYTIHEDFDDLPQGDMSVRWSNWSGSGLVLPIIPVGNWLTVRNHFGHLNITQPGIDYIVSETASVFTLMIVYPRETMWGGGWLYDHLQGHLSYLRQDRNVTLDFSKGDGALFRYLLVQPSRTSDSVDVIIDIVREGYDASSSSVIILFGSAAIIMEALTAMFLVRRITSRHTGIGFIRAGHL